MGRREENGNWFESEERADQQYASFADLSAERRRPVSGAPAGAAADPSVERKRPVSGVPASAGGDPAVERRRPVSGVPASGGGDPAVDRRRPVSGAPAGTQQGPPPPRTRPQRTPDALRDPMPPSSYSPSADVTAALRETTSPVDAATLRRNLAETDGLYRSKKPIFLAVYSALAALGVLLMLPPFLDGMFGKITAASLAPLLAMIAFPLLSLGLYALSTGAATAVQFQGPRVWLRTPLVYLPIALVLFIAAGAAA